MCVSSNESKIAHHAVTVKLTKNGSFVELCICYDHLHPLFYCRATCVKHLFVFNVTGAAAFIHRSQVALSFFVFYFVGSGDSSVVRVLDS